MATNNTPTAAAPIPLPAESPLSAVARRLQTLGRLARKKPVGAFAACFILFMSLLAVIGPSIAPHDPNLTNPARVLEGPAWAYPFGSDQAGRDILSRIIYGARVSLRVSLGAVGLGSVIGVLLGTISAYFGGKFDVIFQRFVDALMSIPLIIIAIMLVSLAAPTLNNLIIALAIAVSPRASRVARGSALAVKHEQYVDAAICIGATSPRIIARHILPNIFAPIIVLFSVTMGAAITAEASLAFLGLGPPTLISWGRMLSAEGREYMQTAWWMAIFPGLTIMLTVLSFNMLGDALRDVLDPRLRGR